MSIADLIAQSAEETDNWECYQKLIEKLKSEFPEDTELIDSLTLPMDGFFELE